MDSDDLQRGRVLTRREALALLGAAGIATLARPSWSSVLSDPETARRLSAGTCVVRPDQTQGPYFVDELLNRSDIRSDPSNGSIRPGTQLDLTFNVSQLMGSVCAPLAGAAFDLWHCDHRGVYSDVQDPGFDTRGQKFLRGYQTTDTSGLVRFTTIYPGWYPGRTVHMHFKLRSSPGSKPSFEFTSQLYFDDSVTDVVHAEEPYASEGQRTLRNSGDGIYSQGGSQLVLPIVELEGVYAAAFDIALEVDVAVEPGTWSGAKRKYRR